MVEKINKFNWLHKFILFFSFVLLFSLFGHIPKAHAFPTCNTTNTAWVNVIVGVEIENYDGSFNSFSSNFNFNADASVPRFEVGVSPNTPNPAVSYLTQAILGDNGGAQGSTPTYNPASRRYDTTVTINANGSGAGSYTHSCAITDAQGNSLSEPVYDFVGPAGSSPPAPNSNDYLNCLAPVDAGNPDNSASFAFDDPVLNNPALAGGTWTVSRVTYNAGSQTLNGSPQDVALFVYQLPPPSVNIQGTIFQKNTSGTYGGLPGAVVVEVDDLTTSTHQDDTVPAGTLTYVISNAARIGDTFAVQVINYPSGYSSPYTDYIGDTSSATYPCNSTGIYRQQIAGVNTSSYNTSSGVCGGSVSPSSIANNEYNFLFIAPSGSPAPTYQPYFNVQGGNIESGISYTPCSPNTNATIAGTNVNSGGSYYGAFGQEAAIAPSTISGFTTAENPNYSSGYSTAPIVGPPSALTLAGLDTGGGVFPECVHDYYAQTNITVATQTSSAPASLSSSGTYLYNGSGPLTIGATTIAASKQIIYVVNNGQNVYIDGNIGFGSYSSVSQIPLFELIVYGSNVYIDPSVSSIRGVYVDEANSGTGGTIVTCGNLSGAIFSYAGCDTNHLLVYGSVSATKIELLRTIGDANSTSFNPAEEFVTSPEEWLPEASIPYTNAPATAQSIQQLPPYL